jgi:hypothetical protein
VTKRLGVLRLMTSSNLVGWSISLRRPSDDTPAQGARFEVHIEKGRGIHGEDAKPFEARFELREGKTAWSVKAGRRIGEGADNRGDGAVPRPPRLARRGDAGTGGEPGLGVPAGPSGGVRRYRSQRPLSAKWSTRLRIWGSEVRILPGAPALSSVCSKSVRNVVRNDPFPIRSQILVRRCATRLPATRRDVSIEGTT